MYRQHIYITVDINIYERKGKQKCERELAIEDMEYYVFINYRSVGNDVEFTDIIAFQVELYNNHVNRIIDTL